LLNREIARFTEARGAFLKWWSPQRQQEFHARLGEMLERRYEPVRT
jgi:hypothetical protein